VPVTRPIRCSASFFKAWPRAVAMLSLPSALCTVRRLKALGLGRQIVLSAESRQNGEIRLRPTSNCTTCLGFRV
jgi:hypothetical protein